MGQLGVYECCYVYVAWDAAKSGGSVQLSLLEWHDGLHWWQRKTVGMLGQSIASKELMYWETSLSFMAESVLTLTCRIQLPFKLFTMTSYCDTAAEAALGSQQLTLLNGWHYLKPSVILLWILMHSLLMDPKPFFYVSCHSRNGTGGTACSLDRNYSDTAEGGRSLHYRFKLTVLLFPNSSSSLASNRHRHDPEIIRQANLIVCF